MNFNKLFIVIIILSLILSISSVCALDNNGTDLNAFEDDCSDLKLDYDNDTISASSINVYVDNGEGSDDNDGQSWQSSVKSLNKALEITDDKGNIYLTNGTYSGQSNSRITISKSINIVGSGNTIFDGLNSNFLFTVSNDAKVTFKNIKFVNAYKKSSYWENLNMYGGALEINNATVIIDNCYFVNNIVDYESASSKYTYGGAISNLGDLTIINSYFDSNLASSTSGIFSHGGSIYNKGKLFINSTIFNNSQSQDFGYGGAIYNDGDMILNNSLIANSYAMQECKGAALYNNGNCILLNSIIENNTISRGSFYYIYGTIYNAKNLNGRGNIFRNNTGIYQAPNPEYRGSPNIYNVGNLNLTYNVFMGNAPFNGIANDVYMSGGKIISLDENWWDSNNDPYSENKINIDNNIKSWMIFTLNPEYTPLDIGENLDIKATITSNSPLPIHINILPVLNVTFTTQYRELSIPLNNGAAIFNFNYTQNKGLYNVMAKIGGCSQNVLVDVGKLNSNVKFNITDNILYTENVVLDVEVTSDDSKALTGNVSVIVNEMIYTINLTGGKGELTISDLSPHVYNFKIVYEGNDDYFKSFNYVNVTVNKAPTILNVSVQDLKIDQKGTVNVTLGPKGVQGQGILYIDGVRKKVVYLYNGQTDVAINNFAEGEYNITVEFLGNKYYAASKASTILKVRKYETALNISVTDIQIGQNQTVTIITNPSDLTGAAILNINGVNKTIFLNKGVTDITISDLGPGTYDIAVTFPENQKYSSSNASASFKVLKTSTNLAVDIIQDNLNATVIVKTNYTDCTGRVGIFVNFKQYEVDLKNGSATFNVVLDKGTNYIYVYYDGDGVYEESNWTTILGVDDEFIFIGANATGFEHIDFKYAIRLIEYNGIAMPNRSVSVVFGDENYTIKTDDDGYAYLVLNLEKGEYQISATYKNQTIYNTLIVNEIKFNVTTNDIEYGEKETVKVTFDKNITGKANLVIVGILNVTLDITDGNVIYNISNIKVGNYEITVKYVNDHFESGEVISSFMVDKAIPSVKSEINDVIYGQDGLIIVTLSNDATGSVLFVIGGNESIKEIDNGTSSITLSNLDKGSYTVNIRYSGDSNYNNVSLNGIFFVKDAKSPLSISINDSKYGENVTVVAILNRNVTGNVTFNIQNMSKSVEIQNGIADWTFSGLNAGAYTIDAVYVGDHTYISSKNSTTFNVSKNNSTVKLFVNEVYLNENIRIYARLSPNATGSVSFSISEYYSPRNRVISNSMASWYISPLGTGKYTVVATYAGDNNYYGSNDTFIMEINQRKSILDVEIANVGINDRIIVNIKLTSSDGEPITGYVDLTIGTANYRVPVNKGSSRLFLARFNEGNYNFNAVYEGNENFTRAGDSGLFKVVDDLLDLRLMAKNLTYFYGNNKNLIVSVVDDTNNPISNIGIEVKVDGVSYTRTSDENGEISIPLNLNVGNYTADMIFNENSKYHSYHTTSTITVLSTVEGIDVTSIYGTSAQYFAIFSDLNGKALSGREVQLIVGDNYYSAITLPNGIARVNINFSPGTYTITAVNPVTGQKASNTIFIFTKLMGNKNVVKYFGGSQTYTVRAFDNNGNPVGSGEIVTFTVNGKTYKVKTNKKGYASCKLNLKPNIYTITANYDDFKVSNKVLVKPVLTAKNVSKKKGKVIKFKAKLVNTKGKPLKGKKITFKFKGKKYKVKTNKKGIATLKLKLKLNVGKYLIKSIYGKSKISNIVKIKK